MKVFLDAGHGGRDPGAIGNGLKEKDINLSVSLKLGKKLEASGYGVNYSRTTDKYIGLTQRATKANNIKADIFVSIHCNAFDSNAKGLETFHYPNSEQGAKLAYNVQNSIVNAKLYTINRGVKNARFTVLHKTMMPAILIELAFIDNKEDSKLLVNNQDDFVNAIVAGIDKYFTKEDKPIEPPKPPQSRRSRYFEVAGLQVIETDPANIYITGMGDNTLRQLGTYGINGTFFNTKNPKPLNSCWMIAVSNGHPLSGNAKFNGWQQPPRGTMYFDGVNVKVKRVKSVVELPSSTVWAIGGGSLIPHYIPKEENWDSSVTYTTNRTGIAFKDNKVLLIVARNMSMLEFRNRIIGQLKVDGAIFLDGGGSTQMFYEGNKGIHSSRGLNNLIGLRTL